MYRVRPKLVLLQLQEQNMVSYKHRVHNKRQLKRVNSYVHLYCNREKPSNSCTNLNVVKSSDVIGKKVTPSDSRYILGTRGFKISF